MSADVVAAFAEAVRAALASGDPDARVVVVAGGVRLRMDRVTGGTGDVRPVELNGCVRDILDHLRRSRDCCWSDIIDAMAEKDYSERTAARWLRWAFGNGLVVKDGRNGPYRVAEAVGPAA